MNRHERYLLMLEVIKTILYAILAGFLVYMAFTMQGCTSMTPPRQHNLILMTPYDHTYTCMLQSMMSMGAVDIRSDKAGGMVSGTVHGAVVMTASLVPIESDKSHVAVTGTILPNKIVVGTMNEVEQYIARVEECK